tara:strand:+ start:502 stop:738 length:237 start_codon:yes stop_codon:yes gene_type:complete
MSFNSIEKEKIKVGMLLSKSSVVDKPSIGIVTWVGRKRWDCFGERDYYKVLWTHSGITECYVGTYVCPGAKIIGTAEK